MRTARSVLFFCLTVLAGVLVVAAFLPGVARADTVSFSVQGQNFSFDTGDGRDGNVELRLKAGDGSKVEVVVNGSVAATLSPPSQTVYKNVMELDGRPLEQRSDLSYRLVNMEDIVPYLPATKSYSPSPSTSAVSTGNALYSYTSSANQDISKEWGPVGGLTVRRVRFKGYNYSYTSGSSTVYYYNYLYALVDGSWVLVAQRRQSYDEWITLPRGTTRVKT
ncbi:MAG: hypothetical protein H5T84_04795, partial [Thermoleophilia bacterium]|nr:hypothetical protein [Thermoleophilia bacterium]